MKFLTVAADFLPIPAALLLLLAGAYFTVRLRGFWLRHPIRTLREMPVRGGLRQMLLSLGGTVGVGNIVGVAVALQLGGAGAVFWMWVGAFLSMALKYAEIVLGQCTRRKTENGYVGGAPYSMEKAFGKFCGGLFAVLLLIDSTVTGGILQSSAIAEAAEGAFGISGIAVGVALALLAAWIFFTDTDLFALSALIVPVMSGLYILLCLAVLAAHISALPGALAQIFAEAFAPRSFWGILLSPALRQGIVKGLFSNEAGCGTAPTAHAAAKEKDPAKQGLFGIFEVFCDTLLLCTLTALTILTSVEPSARNGGAGLCTAALSTLFGSAAPGLLALCIFLFAFATLLSFGYYGVQSLAYFGGRGKKPFLILYCLSLFVGGIAAPRFLWQIADCVICLMLLCNTTAVLAESSTVLSASRTLCKAVCIDRKRKK